MPHPEEAHPQDRPMGVRVSGGGPTTHPTSCWCTECCADPCCCPEPSEPRTYEEALEDVHRRYCTTDAHDPVCHLLHISETDVHTEWALDCREPVGIFSSILVCHDQHEAQGLAITYQRPVLSRRVYTIRRTGEWEIA